jgi:N12 class adenine-specific DNA methylase
MDTRGPKQKARDNIEAIRLIKTCAQEERFPEPEERAAIAQFYGFGGIPQAFPRPDGSMADGWEKIVADLQAVTTPTEYAAIRRSTIDAHYTADAVVEALWAGVERMGMGKIMMEPFRVLEPSIGSGVFFALMPESLRRNPEMQLMGIELDPLSAAVATVSFPKEKIRRAPFQAVSLRYPVDLVIGNPPFGSQKLLDTDRPDLTRISPNTHGYFFAKSVDALSPGGVAALVVSAFLLDANREQHQNFRRWLHRYADLLHAVRLPRTAFSKTAFTDVVTDLIVLRKREEPLPEDTPDPVWIDGKVELPERTADDEPIRVNGWYVEHPEYLLGTPSLSGKMYGAGREKEFTLDPLPERSLDELLAERFIAVLPQDGFGQWKPRATDTIERPEYPEVDREQVGRVQPFGYFVVPEAPAAILRDRFGPTQSGLQIVRRMPDDFEGNFTYRLIAEQNAKHFPRLAGLIALRDTAMELIERQLEREVTDGQLRQLRADLNRHYDRFVKEFGYLNAPANARLLRRDPGSPVVLGLEVEYDKGVSREVAKRTGETPRKPSAKKSDLFAKRTQFPIQPVEHADSARDALFIVLAESGAIHWHRILALTGKSWEEVAVELRLFTPQALAFETATGVWEERSAFLSGDILSKIEEIDRALQAVDDEERRQSLQTSREALIEVRPAPIPAELVTVHPGAPYVPEVVVREFLESLGLVNSSATYLNYTGQWLINGLVQGATAEQFQVSRRALDKLIEDLFNHRSPVIYDTDEQGNRSVNEEETALAIEKVKALRERWYEWVRSDPERLQKLADEYNNRFNRIVRREYDGRHLTLPGSSSAISLRPHQKNAVWRACQGKSVLFDHKVGAGKTFAAIAAVMEKRRMGQARKPIVTVPNHLVGQWANAWLALYPAARILVGDEQDMNSQHRQEFLARAAYNDWDAVILSHSAFKLIPVDPGFYQEFLEREVVMIEDLLRNIPGLDGMTVKQMEKKRQSLVERAHRMHERVNSHRDQGILHFGEVGFDYIVNDESHMHKNVPYMTMLKGVSGLGNPAGSERAEDMFVKVTQARESGAGVLFLTGTPISNTIAEMYLLMRYLAPEILEQQSIYSFDGWVSTFATVNEEFAFTLTGQFQSRKTLSEFNDVPTLVEQYKSFADIIGQEDIDRLLRAEGKKAVPLPKIRGGKPQIVTCPMSEVQRQIVGVEIGTNQLGEPIYAKGSILHRLDNLPKKPEPGADNILVIINDLKKVSLDARAFDPTAPASPVGKIPTCVDNILDVYQRWDADKGAQLVYLDFSTPKGARGKLSAEVREILDLLQQVEAGEDEEASDLVRERAEAAQEKLEKFSPMEVEEARRMAKGLQVWSAYEEIRDQLIARGIPAEEIAFIHDANTDLRKEELFGRVRSGAVRVLIGSTGKMGPGMNVQDRLVGIHHLDAPYRPSDVEQRNGRIIRQGNKLLEKYGKLDVDVFYYVTENSSDAGLWQILETKDKFINSIRFASGSRTATDPDAQAMDPAAVKAMASGHELLMTEVPLRSRVKNLERLEKAYRSETWMRGNRLDQVQEEVTQFAEERPAREREAELARQVAEEVAERKKQEGKNFRFLWKGEPHTRREINQEAIRIVELLFTFRASRIAPLGDFEGFQFSVERSDDEIFLLMEGPEGMEYIGRYFQPSAESDFAQRMLNLIRDIPNDLAERRRLDANNQQLMEDLSQAVDQKFGRQDELAVVREQHQIAETLMRMRVRKWSQIAETFEVLRVTPEAVAKQMNVAAIDADLAEGKITDREAAIQEQRLAIEAQLREAAREEAQEYIARAQVAFSQPPLTAQSISILVSLGMNPDQIERLKAEHGVLADDDTAEADAVEERLEALLPEPESGTHLESDLQEGAESPVDMPLEAPEMPLEAMQTDEVVVVRQETPVEAQKGQVSLFGDSAVSVPASGQSGDLFADLAVPPAASQQSIKPEPIEKVWAGLAQFLTPEQAMVTRMGLQGPDAAFFDAKVRELASVVANLPKTYETDGQGMEATAYLHYFTGSADWFVTELDADPDRSGQVQAFGLADLGMGFPELGYFSLPELLAAGAELDYHFTPKSLQKLQAERELQVEAARKDIPSRADSPARAAMTTLPSSTPRIETTGLSFPLDRPLTGWMVPPPLTPEMHLGYRSTVTEGGEGTIFRATSRGDVSVLRFAVNGDAQTLTFLGDWFIRGDQYLLLGYLTMYTQDPIEALRKAGFDLRRLPVPGDEEIMAYLNTWQQAIAGPAAEHAPSTAREVVESIPETEPVSVHIPANVLAWVTPEQRDQWQAMWEEEDAGLRETLRAGWLRWSQALADAPTIVQAQKARLDGRSALALRSETQTIHWFLTGLSADGRGAYGLRIDEKGNARLGHADLRVVRWEAPILVLGHESGPLRADLRDAGIASKDVQFEDDLRALYYPSRKSQDFSGKVTIQDIHDAEIRSGYRVQANEDVQDEGGLDLPPMASLQWVALQPGDPEAAPVVVDHPVIFLTDGGNTLLVAEYAKVAEAAQRRAEHTEQENPYVQAWKQACLDAFAQLGLLERTIARRMNDPEVSHVALLDWAREQLKIIQLPIQVAQRDLVEAGMPESSPEYRAASQSTQAQSYRNLLDDVTKSIDGIAQRVRNLDAPSGLVISDALRDKILAYIIQSKPVLIEIAKNTDLDPFLQSTFQSASSDVLVAISDDGNIQEALRQEARGILQGPSGMTDYRRAIGQELFARIRSGELLAPPREFTITEAELQVTPAGVIAVPIDPASAEPAQEDQVTVQVRMDKPFTPERFPDLTGTLHAPYLLRETDADGLHIEKDGHIVLSFAGEQARFTGNANDPDDLRLWTTGLLLFTTDPEFALQQAGSAMALATDAEMAGYLRHWLDLLPADAQGRMALRLAAGSVEDRQTPEALAVRRDALQKELVATVAANPSVRAQASGHNGWDQFAQGSVQQALQEAWTDLLLRHETRRLLPSLEDQREALIQRVYERIQQELHQNAQEVPESDQKTVLYRGGTAGNMPRHVTIDDILAYERSELENDISPVQEAIDNEYLRLPTARLRSLQWVATSAEEAEEYGAVREVVFRDPVYLARDPFGGLLVAERGELEAEKLRATNVPPSPMQVAAPAALPEFVTFVLDQPASSGWAGHPNLLMDSVHEDYRLRSAAMGQRNQITIERTDAEEPRSVLRLSLEDTGKLEFFPRGADARDRLLVAAYLALYTSDPARVWADSGVGLPLPDGTEIAAYLERWQAEIRLRFGVDRESSLDRRIASFRARLAPSAPTTSMEGGLAELLPLLTEMDQEVVRQAGTWAEMQSETFRDQYADLLDQLIALRAGRVAEAMQASGWTWGGVSFTHPDYPNHKVFPNNETRNGNNVGWGYVRTVTGQERQVIRDDFRDTPEEMTARLVDGWESTVGNRAAAEAEEVKSLVADITPESREMEGSSMSDRTDDDFDDFEELDVDDLGDLDAPAPITEARRPWMRPILNDGGMFPPFAEQELPQVAGSRNGGLPTLCQVTWEQGNAHASVRISRSLDGSYRWSTEYRHPMIAGGKSVDAYGEAKRESFAQALLAGRAELLDALERAHGGVEGSHLQQLANRIAANAEGDRILRADEDAESSPEEAELALLRERQQRESDLLIRFGWGRFHQPAHLTVEIGAGDLPEVVARDAAGEVLSQARCNPLDRESWLAFVRQIPIDDAALAVQVQNCPYGTGDGAALVLRAPLQAEVAAKPELHWPQDTENGELPIEEGPFLLGNMDRYVVRRWENVSGNYLQMAIGRSPLGYHSALGVRYDNYRTGFDPNVRTGGMEKRPARGSFAEALRDLYADLKKHLKRERDLGAHLVNRETDILASVEAVLEGRDPAIPVREFAIDKTLLPERDLAGVRELLVEVRQPGFGMFGNEQGVAQGQSWVLSGVREEGEKDHLGEFVHWEDVVRAQAHAFARIAPSLAQQPTPQAEPIAPEVVEEKIEASQSRGVGIFRSVYPEGAQALVLDDGDAPVEEIGNAGLAGTLDGFDADFSKIRLSGVWYRHPLVENWLQSRLFTRGPWDSLEQSVAVARQLQGQEIRLQRRQSTGDVLRGAWLWDLRDDQNHLISDKTESFLEQRSRVERALRADAEALRAEDSTVLLDQRVDGGIVRAFVRSPQDHALVVTLYHRSERLEDPLQRRIEAHWEDADGERGMEFPVSDEARRDPVAWISQMRERFPELEVQAVAQRQAIEDLQDSLLRQARQAMEDMHAIPLAPVVDQASLLAYAQSLGNTQKAVDDDYQARMKQLQEIGVAPQDRRMHSFYERPGYRALMDLDKNAKALLDQAQSKVKRETIDRGKRLLDLLPEDAAAEDIAQAIFLAHGIEVAKTPAIVEHIRDRDVEAIQGLIGKNSMNPASQEVFTRLTGVNLGKTQAARMAQIDEWAGISREDRAAIEAEKERQNRQGKAWAMARQAWGRLEFLEVSYERQVLSVGEVIRRKADEGFTVAVLEKPEGGGRTQAAIRNPENGETYRLSDKEFRNLVAAIVEGDLDPEHRILPVVDQLQLASAPAVDDQPAPAPVEAVDAQAAAEEEPRADWQQGLSALGYQETSENPRGEGREHHYPLPEGVGALRVIERDGVVDEAILRVEGIASPEALYPLLLGLDRAGVGEHLSRAELVQREEVAGIAQEHIRVASPQVLEQVRTLEGRKALETLLTLGNMADDAQRGDALRAAREVLASWKERYALPVAATVLLAPEVEQTRAELQTALGADYLQVVPDGELRQVPLTDWVRQADLVLVVGERLTHPAVAALIDRNFSGDRKALNKATAIITGDQIEWHRDALIDLVQRRARYKTFDNERLAGKLAAMLATAPAVAEKAVSATEPPAAAATIVVPQAEPAVAPAAAPESLQTAEVEAPELAEASAVAAAPEVAAESDPMEVPAPEAVEAREQAEIPALPVGEAVREVDRAMPDASPEGAATSAAEMPVTDDIPAPVAVSSTEGSNEATEWPGDAEQITITPPGRDLDAQNAAIVALAVTKVNWPAMLDALREQKGDADWDARECCTAARQWLRQENIALWMESVHLHFEVADNPVQSPTIRERGAHDMLGFANRIIVDPWAGLHLDGKPFLFDYENERHAKIVQNLYGETSQWELWDKFVENMRGLSLPEPTEVVSEREILLALDRIQESPQWKMLDPRAIEQWLARAVEVVTQEYRSIERMAASGWIPVTEEDLRAILSRERLLFQVSHALYPSASGLEDVLTPSGQMRMWRRQLLKELPSRKSADMIRGTLHEPAILAEVDRRMISWERITTAHMPTLAADLDEKMPEILVHMDALYRETLGDQTLWHIVDAKSPRSLPDSVSDAYLLQLNAYAEALQRVLEERGEQNPQIRLHLAFGVLAEGRMQMVEVPRDPELMARVLDKLETLAMAVATGLQPAPKGQPMPKEQEEELCALLARYERYKIETDAIAIELAELQKEILDQQEGYQPVSLLGAGDQPRVSLRQVAPTLRAADDTEWARLAAAAGVDISRYEQPQYDLEAVLQALAEQGMDASRFVRGTSVDVAGLKAAIKAAGGIPETDWQWRIDLAQNQEAKRARQQQVDAIRKARGADPIELPEEMQKVFAEYARQRESQPVPQATQAPEGQPESAPPVTVPMEPQHPGRTPRKP